MASAALSHDALLPRAPGGLVPGAALSLVVHGGLVAALALGVSWRHQEPDVFSAELWSSVPEVAAPRAPEPVPSPPPPPPPPVATPAPPPPPPGPSAADIALEKERAREQAAADARKLAETKKAAADKKAADDKKLADAKKASDAKASAKAAAEQAAEEKRLEAQRQENLKRLLAQAGGTGAPTSTGTAARSAAPSNTYAGVLIAHIRERIVMPDRDRLPPTLQAVVEVRSTASGTVLSSKLIKASGNPAWDEAVLRAIDRAGTLPRDTDGRVPTVIEISFRPSD
jgi:colicin import membrane protein